MQPAYWWFATTVFAITGLYFYWSRRRRENQIAYPVAESVDSPA
jgi:hypothetical protein